MRRGWLCLSGVALLAFVLSGCAGVETRGVSGSVATVTLLQQAHTARERGELTESLSHYRRVLTQEPDNHLAHLGAGEVLLQLYRPEQALPHFDHALSDNPDLVEGLEGRSYALLGLRRLTAAQTTLSRVVQLDPSRWRAWSALGVLADLRGEHVEAQADYDKALALLPGHPLLLNNRAFSLMLLGRYTEAQSLLEAALVHDPEDLRVRNNLSWCLAWQKNYMQALEVLAPYFTPAQAQNNIGFLAMLQGDYPAAETYFRQAMKLSPVYYERAANNLAELQYRMQGEQTTSQASVGGSEPLNGP